MPEILADLIDQGLQVLHERENLDDPRGRDPHGIIVGEPIRRERAVVKNGDIGNPLPAIKV